MTMEGLSKVIAAIGMALFLLPATSFADAGIDADAGMDADMGVFDMDGPDLGPSDMGFDSGTMDAGSSDGGVIAPDDMGLTDAGNFDQGTFDQGTFDQGPGDQGPGDQGADLYEATATFSGDVTLEPEGTGSITILLDSAENRYQQSIFSRDGFVFEDIPTGVYDVRISALGYESVEDTIDLTSDRTADYELFTVATALLLGDVSLDGEESGTVVVRGTSPRGEFSEELEVTNGMGEFSRELAAARWTVEFSSEGFLPVTQTVVIPDDRESTSISVRLYRAQSADVEVNEGCNCRVAGSAQTPWAAFAIALLAALFMLRRSRNEESS